MVAGHFECPVRGEAEYRTSFLVGRIKNRLDKLAILFYNYLIEQHRGDITMANTVKTAAPEIRSMQAIHYMGIRSQLPISQFPPFIGACMDELMAWRGAKIMSR